MVYIMEQVISSNIGMMVNLDNSAEAGDSLDYSNPDLVAKKADLVKARQYRDSTCFMKKVQDKYEKYPIWSTSLSEIGQYGSGLQLYMEVIKLLCIGFFIISCISIYPIYLNADGDGLYAGEVRQRWDMWAVSNTEWVEASDEIDNNESTLFKLFVSDAGYSVFFLIWIIFIQIRSNKIVHKNLQNNVTLADYSIEVTGLPQDDCSKQSVKKHFEQFGNVHEVFLARKYEGLLKVYREKAEISSELAYFNLQKKFGKKVDRKIKKLKEQIEKFQKKIEDKDGKIEVSHDRLKIIKAYVVFEDAESKKNCLETYKKDKGCCKRLKRQRENLKFERIHPLKVKTTYAPSDILYENLEITTCSKLTRRFISLILVIIAVIISAGMLYGLKLYQSELPTANKCSGLGIIKSKTLKEAKSLYKSDTKKYCYCKKQSFDKILKSTDMMNYCSYFMQKMSMIISLRVLVSLGLVVVNVAINLVFRLLGKFERHSSRTDEQRKLMGKVFLATFINTALVVLAVNFDYEDDDGYSDFSRYWYVDVGSTIVTTMIISIFSPHCVNLVLFYPLGLINRHCCTKRYVSQIEANKKFSGADFDLASRNAFILTVVFTCFLYSGGMPMLNVICFLTMLCLYWVEKFLILRHYKRPPLFNHSLNDQLVKLLPISVIFHCSFSLYMYGASDLFPSKYLGIDEDEEPEYETNSIYERIERNSGIANLAIIGFTIGCLGWIFLYSSIFKCIFKKKIVDVSVMGRGKIEQELEKIRMQGFDSYDIKKHGEYKELVKAMECRTKRSGINETMVVDYNTKF